MTPMQQQTLSYVRTYWAAKGLGPRHIDISRHLGLVRTTEREPSTTVQRLLRALQLEGLVEIAPGVARGVRPTGKCPCCRREAA